MKSIRAGPDLVPMSRCSAAMDACVCAISPATMAGSVSSGVGARRQRRHDLTLVRDRRDEVVAFQNGLQRIPDQRIAPPHDFEEARTPGGGGQALGDVDEQPPAGLVHPREG